MDRQHRAALPFPEDPLLRVLYSFQPGQDRHQAPRQKGLTALRSLGDHQVIFVSRC
jgi:hypothetical protein